METGERKPETGNKCKGNETGNQELNWTSIKELERKTRHQGPVRTRRTPETGNEPQPEVSITKHRKPKTDYEWVDNQDRKDNGNAENKSSVTKDKKPKIDKSRLITKDWEPISDWGTTSQWPNTRNLTPTH